MDAAHSTSLLLDLFYRSPGVLRTRKRLCRSDNSELLCQFQPFEGLSLVKRSSRIAYNGRSRTNPCPDTPRFLPIAISSACRVPAPSRRTPIVDCHRRSVSQPLVRSLRVVEPEVPTQSLPRRDPIGVIPQIDLLVFDRSP